MRVRTYQIRAQVLFSTLSLLASAGVAEASITLAWDPSPDAEVVAYRVYVGTESGAYSEAHDVDVHQTSFVYTSTAAGIRYYFAVASIGSDGEVGWPSEEVSGLDSSLGSRPATSALVAPDSGLPQEICTGTGVCYSATVLSAGLGSVSALTPTRDGRLFFIEDRRRVRVLTRPGVPPEIALESGRDVTTLALDPTFAQTGFMLVGESNPRVGRADEFAIVRYRELAGTLGEGAAIVVGLELPPGAVAPVAVDAQRRIYVALPRKVEQRETDPYAGQLLWFNADGTVPPSSGSPVLAAGFADPAALNWMAPDQLWLAGSDDHGGAALAYLEGERPGAQRSQAMGLPVPSGVEAMAFALEGERQDERALFLIAADGRLYRAELTAAGLPETEALTGPLPGVAVAIAAGQDALYVAIRGEAPEVAGSFTILRLIRQRRFPAN